MVQFMDVLGVNTDHVDRLIHTRDHLTHMSISSSLSSELFRTYRNVDNYLYDFHRLENNVPLCVLS